MRIQILFLYLYQHKRGNPLKISIMNSYKYAIQKGNVSGYFNVYQSKAGSIFLVMGNSYTKLEYNQVIELNIDVYSLIDFDYCLFKKYYNQ